MTTPRIYTYKITFEEVPYWYWGVHKKKKFGEFYLGSPKTHKWMWEFYTPKIQILEFFPYTDEGWKEANLVEDRIIKPDINNLLCLNEAYGAYVSLACRSEGGKKGAEKLHEAKDENGKSLQGLEAAKRLHEAKDGNGKSLHSLEMNKKLHEAKDENGKSLHGLESAKRLHRAKGENGKSLVALRLNEKIHKEKDENGKSVHAVEAAKKTHEAKDENGKSLVAMKTNAQIWESTIDGFRSHASGVARHNRANGWDPNARIRVK